MYCPNLSIKEHKIPFIILLTVENSFSKYIIFTK